MSLCDGVGVMQEYTDEIEKLKKDLLATRDKNGIYISPENYASVTL